MKPVRRPAPSVTATLRQLSVCFECFPEFDISRSGPVILPFSSLLYKLRSTSLCLSALPDKRSCRSLVALSFAAASLIWVKEVVTLPPCRSLWASDHTNSHRLNIKKRWFLLQDISNLHCNSSHCARCFEVEQQPSHKFLQTVGVVKRIFWQCCVGPAIKKKKHCVFWLIINIYSGSWVCSS